MITTVKMMRVGKVKKGEFVKWDHLEWRKVAYIGNTPKDTDAGEIPEGLEGGWVYIKFEGLPHPHSIWHDVELPWHA